MRPHRITLLLASIALLAACSTSSASNDAGGDPSAESPYEAYVAPGPHPVGVTTLGLASGAKVEVWYPATKGTTGTDTYDVRDYTPEIVRNLLTGDAPSTYTSPAARDAEPSDGRFPVVLFSHGYSGMRVQSTFLTAHLASWGMVVIAPDHWSRDLPRTLVGATTGTSEDAVGDLFSALDLVSADDMLGSRVDTERVAVVGHSAGGGTALLAAEEESVDGYVSMASGDLRDGSGPMPAKPSFFLAGAVDGVVPAQERTKPAFDRAPSPSLLWIIDGVGHNGFDDFCTFGNGTGIIGVAEASGLGGLLASNPQLRRLGEDGCIPPAAEVDLAFPLIRHGVTAWLRHLFGIDAEPLGLTGPGLADESVFELPVGTISSK